MFEEFMEISRRVVTALERIADVLSRLSAIDVANASIKEEEEEREEEAPSEGKKVTFGEGYTESHKDEGAELSRDEIKERLGAALGGQDKYNTRCGTETLARALKLVGEERHCIACGGTGSASKGGTCVPCSGTGERKMLPKEEPESSVLDDEPEETDKTPEYTEDDVRIELAKVMQDERVGSNKDARKRKIKEIVRSEGGAEKLKDVPSERFGAIIKAAKLIIESLDEEEDLEI